MRRALVKKIFLESPTGFRSRAIADIELSLDALDSYWNQLQEDNIFGHFSKKKFSVMKLTIFQFSISTAYKIDNIQDSASLRLLKEAEYWISIDLLIRNKNIAE